MEGGNRPDGSRGGATKFTSKVETVDSIAVVVRGQVGDKRTSISMLDTVPYLDLHLSGINILNFPSSRGVLDSKTHFIHRHEETFSSLTVLRYLAPQRGMTIERNPSTDTVRRITAMLKTWCLIPCHVL